MPDLTHACRMADVLSSHEDSAQSMMSADVVEQLRSLTSRRVGDPNLSHAGVLFGDTPAMNAVAHARLQACCKKVSKKGALKIRKLTSVDLSKVPEQVVEDLSAQVMKHVNRCVF